MILGVASMRKFMFLCFLILGITGYSNAEEIAEKKNVDSGNAFSDYFTEPKKDFFVIKIDDEEYAINPYLGLGYQFSISSYNDGSPAYASYAPTMFHSGYITAGAYIGEHLFVELGSSISGLSVTDGGSGSLNTLHLDVGYSLGEEYLGEYGKNNKIYALVGVVFGFGNLSVRNVGTISENFFSAAPELGIGYQRFITDRFSIRFDVRASSAKLYNSNGAINGLFMISAMWHL